MRVHVLPADEAGCGSYRIIWPAQLLAQAGHDVTIVPVQRINPALRAKVADGRVVEVTTPNCDVMVFQRPMGQYLAQTIPLLQAQGVGCVIEVDDDFSALPASNVAFAYNHPRRDPGVNWTHLQACARLADAVVVTTPALTERYGRPGVAQVVPNFIPARYLDITGTPNEQVTIGWSGTLTVHAGDPQVTRGALSRVAAATGARIRIIGPIEEQLGFQQAFGVINQAMEVTGWVPIDQYPQVLANLDIGMVPLAGNRFNAAKSFLKGLEMASLGVPFVASPTPEYRRLAELGAGRLAAKPKDWVRELTRLVQDPGWRAELAHRGRQVAASLTLEAHADRFWQAWTAGTRSRRAGGLEPQEAGRTPTP